jgi:hypothetical protein
MVMIETTIFVSLVFQATPRYLKSRDYIVGPKTKRRKCKNHNFKLSCVSDVKKIWTDCNTFITSIARYTVVTESKKRPLSQTRRGVSVS